MARQLQYIGPKTDPVAASLAE